MIDSYVSAGKGLSYLFWAEIIKLAGSLLRGLWHPLGTLSAIAGGALFLYGLYIASPAHDKFKAAMVFSLAGLVLSAVSLVLHKVPLIGTLLTLAELVASLLEVHCVCEGAGSLLRDKGDDKLAAGAELLWKLHALCVAVIILCTLVAWIPILNILAALVSVVPTLALAVGYILEVLFYRSASASLLA